MSGQYELPELVALQTICKKIIDMPYCSGTIELSAPLLFYRSENSSKCIDFSNPTQEQLQDLADACAPASFGRNQENVLDESYRKAGAMDTSNFAVQFSPWDSGILKVAVDTLFKGSIANVKAELYKLNVYSPGSFFNAHVDTPRGDTMFGSLVVVLPTPHTGGSLLFKHHESKYAFDSAAAVSTSSPEAPLAAFAAFFSDVEHKVAEVTSGYRVTLTYNLYNTSSNGDRHSKISPPTSGITIQDESQTVLSLSNALTSLLSIPTFLPDGGLLAFGLAYQYPFTPQVTMLPEIARRLKGIDALLKRACDASGLQVSVKALYRDYHRSYGNDISCFLDHFVRFGEDQIEEPIVQHLTQCIRGAIVGYDIRNGAPSTDDYDEEGYARGTEILGVVWAKALDSKNAFEEQYIAYGNEASMACAYGKVCLVVRVKPAGQRL
ncbi:hypothetical protein BDN70DRAFT_885327 [Pholiota conissans]|uniref:Fe2OG dioxygenase domain-containing protein n=1 Tax=Pholiota conissans TaxID=109636 RepID=A0A9P5YSP6_9AGAR|nr:hypothetical protein BDN70DRAFT_885327 [Pholiota conissans]